MKIKYGLARKKATKKQLEMIKSLEQKFFGFILPNYNYTQYQANSIIKKYLRYYKHNRKKLLSGNQ
jgi:hypothetical protein